MHDHLPIPLLALDSDNGSEFINQILLAYCQSQAITRSQSRSRVSDGWRAAEIVSDCSIPRSTWESWTSKR